MRWGKGGGGGAGPIKQAGVAEEAVLIRTLTLLPSACFFGKIPKHFDTQFAIF